MTQDLTQIATRFLTMTAEGEVDQAYAHFVADDFIHHNSHFAGDRASLHQAMRDSATAMPGKQLRVVQIMQQGEKVMAYSRVTVAGKQMEFAAFHMFRFRGEQIVELWDLAQMVDRGSPNQHGMF